MILVPIIGYRTSGKSLMLEWLRVSCDDCQPLYFSDNPTKVDGWNVDDGENSYIILESPPKRWPFLHLIRSIERYRALLPEKPIIFEWAFSLKEFERLQKLFHGAQWLAVHLHLLHVTCANRMAIGSALRRKSFEKDEFFADCTRFDRELRKAERDYGLRVCTIADGLPAEASVAKLKRYIETAIKLEKEQHNERK